MASIIPPGGFAGFSQQVSAVKGMFSRAVGRAAQGTYRKKRAGGVRIGPGRSLVRQSSKGLKRITRKSRVSTTRVAGARTSLVKGSAAAKAWGKKMRAARKKKR